MARTDGPAAPRSPRVSRGRNPLDDGRRRSLELDAGQLVDAHHLDQGPDLRLCAAQQDRTPVAAQPAGEHREVEHQRHVGEAELGEIDDHVGLGAEGARQSAAPDSLGAAVLVAGAAQDRRAFGEIDDPGNLPNANDATQGFAAQKIGRAIGLHCDPWHPSRK